MFNFTMEWPPHGWWEGKTHRFNPILTKVIITNESGFIMQGIQYMLNLFITVIIESKTIFTSFCKPYLFKWCTIIRLIVNYVMKYSCFNLQNVFHKNIFLVFTSAMKDVCYHIEINCITCWSITQNIFRF